MSIRQAASDVGIGLIGGYVGTKAMEQVSMKLYEMESEQTRKKEEEIRPGDPYMIAAEKMTEALGIELSEDGLQKLAIYGFHYGLGMGWGPTYTFLRRWTDLNLVLVGLLSGAAMSLLVDEGTTPLMGFTAPTATTRSPPTSGASLPTWCSDSGWRQRPKRSAGSAATEHPGQSNWRYEL